jgi:hypothetical protein
VPVSFSRRNVPHEIREPIAEIRAHEIFHSGTVLLYSRYKISINFLDVRFYVLVR